MSTQYTLKVVNNSTQSGSVCVYQRDPEQEKYANLYSLAWFSKKCHPGTTLTFRWILDYCFTWSETGELKPGVTFEASQSEDADPSDASKDAIGFSKTGGAYAFTTPLRPGTPGELRIQTDGTIPINEASVGIGMSGNPALAVSAGPNLDYAFIPHPEYWIAFGDYEEGQVIDLNRVTETAKIVFPLNTYSLSITLQEDNTWSDPITLKQRNTMLIEQMRIRGEL